ncbi:MAG: hypothetical protein WC641_04055 [Patescibacteria group bacterium]
MPDIQDIFNRLQAKKKEKKKIHSAVRDALLTSKPYQDLVEELRRVREKKRGLEDQIKAQFASEMSEMEKIESDVKSDNQLVCDMALTKIMRGESIELQDENDTKYLPVLTVKFQKTK